LSDILNQLEQAMVHSITREVSYHVSMRCNNQAFDLRRPQPRKEFLFVLPRATRHGPAGFGKYSLATSRAVGTVASARRSGRASSDAVR
jgi:hypothetical protein